MDYGIRSLVCRDAEETIQAAKDLIFDAGVPLPGSGIQEIDRAQGIVSPGVIVHDTYLPPWTALEYRVELVADLGKLAARYDKLLLRILRGGSDTNIGFDEYGETISGSVRAVITHYGLGGDD